MFFTTEPTDSKAKMQNVFTEQLANEETVQSLAVSMIYGANASGKSNIIKFIYGLCRWIRNIDVKKYKNKDSVIIPETGCFPTAVVDAEKRFHHKCLRMLWVGKFDYRKQLEIALKTVSKLSREKGLNSEDIKLIVCGTGNDEQVEHYHQMGNTLGISTCVVWKGQCKHENISLEMRNADLLLFTSISDDTSTVVMEAISNHLPVLCHNAMGFGCVVTDDCGMKVPLINKKTSVNEFAGKIMKVYNNRELLKEMSEGCRAVQNMHLWDYKAKEMMKIYNTVVKASDNLGGDTTVSNCKIVSITSCQNNKKYA